MDLEAQTYINILKENIHKAIDERVIIEAKYLQSLNMIQNLSNKIKELEDKEPKIKRGRKRGTNNPEAKH